jgi:catechol-2,3-dioxygenase
MGNRLIEGVDGVFIPVQDLEKSVKWYQEVLELELLYREEEAAVLKVSDQSPVICLVRVTNHQPVKFPENNWDVSLFYNFKTYDIERTYKLLKERGVDISGIAEEEKLDYFGFRDPDGNKLGVCYSKL